ncbi:UNVERIFIED_CONTAM: hypothetical protein HDU68_012126 [Siphonaria sp. JEL0065]|nr:hypothetical protein HDU68_012126 [Siphonaria sp. JEL0065]
MRLLPSLIVAAVSLTPSIQAQAVSTSAATSGSAPVIQWAQITPQTHARGLIISPGDKSEEYPQMTFNSYQYAFDTLVLSPSSLWEAPLDLEITPGVLGKYNVIVLSSGQMIAQFPNASYLPTLYDWQFQQLHTYQQTYSVPLVAINDIPTATIFTNKLTGFNNAAACNYATTLSLTQSPNTKTIIDASGLTSQQIFPLVAGDGYQNASCNFPATILDIASITPILSFTPNSGIAAAVINFGNNQTQFSYFFPCGSWSRTCTLLGNVWFQWAVGSAKGGSSALGVVSQQLGQSFLSPNGNSTVGGSGGISTLTVTKTSETGGLMVGSLVLGLFLGLML